MKNIRMILVIIWKYYTYLKLYIEHLLRYWSVNISNKH